MYDENYDLHCEKSVSFIFSFNFPFNLPSQVTPWVEQTYEGNDLIDVKCGSDVLIAADLPFSDNFYIFDNYSGNWQVVDLPQTQEYPCEWRCCNGIF